MVIGAVEVGPGLALLDALLKHQVHALAGTLDQAAAVDRVGDPPVARLLPIQDILDRHSLGQAAGADDLQTAGELAHEYGRARAVVAVADGVQDRLAHGTLVERGHVQYNEAVLEVLLVVAQVDAIPNGIVEEEKALPVILPVLRRAGGFLRAVLEDDFPCARCIERGG